MVERAPAVGNGWGAAAIGGLLIFIGGEGLIHLLSNRGGSAEALSQGGGSIGHFMSSGLGTLISPIGAFVVLLAIVIAGILLLFQLTLRGLLQPVTRGGRAIAAATTATVASAVSSRQDLGNQAAKAIQPVAVPIVTSDPARSRGRTAEPRAATPDYPPQLPTPVSSPAPMSQTVWSAPAGEAPPRGAVTATAVATAVRPRHRPLGGRRRRRDRCRCATSAAGLDLAGGRVAGCGASVKGGAELDHERNVKIIEEKLRSFQIPAEVVGTNTGPVVTQYEVKPDVRVKLSRIEGLADDLAMALAARSIRIEAPIPGRDVVGIEDPQPLVRGGRLQEALRGCPDGGGQQQADLRPRPRRLGQGLRGGPGAHAAPADRRGHRLGQERLRQRPHHQPADARHARRGQPRAGGPEARRAGRLRRPAASQDGGHRRAAAGARRAGLGGRRDGGPLQAAGSARRAQHRGLQRQPPGGARGAAAVPRGRHR